MLLTIDDDHRDSDRAKGPWDAAILDRVERGRAALQVRVPEIWSQESLNHAKQKEGRPPLRPTAAVLKKKHS